LPEPVFTPTTKFEKNDRPLTPQEAIKEGLIQADIWERLKDVALKLFVSGQKTAAKKGLILVDTKYEFGLDKQGELVLIDEIHTPDSSRYWRADSYKAQIEKSEEPDNYDKEYLRLWYKARFDPYKDKTAPKVPTDILQEMANRYTFVYEQLLGKPFVADKTADPLARIEKNVLKALEG
jgi:phosphoribosylaminoimidazole-succinocarboxamide synthase